MRCWTRDSTTSCNNQIYQEETRVVSERARTLEALTKPQIVPVFQGVSGGFVRASYREFLQERPDMRQNCRWMVLDGKREFMVNYECIKVFAAWAEEKGRVDPRRAEQCLKFLRCQLQKPHPEG
jgi:hypothetical protein